MTATITKNRALLFISWHTGEDCSQGQVQCWAQSACSLQVPPQEFWAEALTGARGV